MSTEIPDGICYNNITEINDFCEVIIMLNNVKNGSVKILPGVFRERMDVNRRYLMELDANCLLQNFYLEAGIILPGLQVVDDPTPAEPVYDPTHPLADERGYVYESNVDVATEQLDSVEAENMYSANLAVFEVVKSMATKALNIGKS